MRRWSGQRIAGAPGNAAAWRSSRVIRRTASHNSALSLGSCISAAVTVLSIRTIAPASTLACSGRGNQRPIDRLPGLGADRADGPMQDRLLRRPRQRQAGKGAKGRRIFQMKGQFLVTELALLFQAARSAAPFPPAARAARSGADPRAADRPPPGSPARAAHPASPRLPSARSRSGVRQRPRISSPGRCVPDALSAPAVAVGLWLQWLDPKLTRKPPGLLAK